MKKNSHHNGVNMMDLQLYQVCILNEIMMRDMKDFINRGNTRFFFYKHKVHKHAQPQIGRILSTLLSTAPASDLVVDTKIHQNLQLFL